MRKISINNIPKESTNHLTRVELNVFRGAREGIAEGGKFYEMFMAGDGHELEDKAKSLFSSSMLAYNFFYWVSPEHPLTYAGITYDRVYFEVKFPVMLKGSKGRPVNRPSNMDVVLFSTKSNAMICVESKYTEHTNNRQATFADAYFKHACYYPGNPYIASFIQLALRYNEKSDGYYEGIKQNVSHMIGVCNVLHDTDAQTWFKANNPFIEPEVMARIGSETVFFFTNLLYEYPKEVTRYPDLLDEFADYYLSPRIQNDIVLLGIRHTYQEFYQLIYNQMPAGLPEYLNQRYCLSFVPRYPLPEGVKSADKYLAEQVFAGAKERYGDGMRIEVQERIEVELEKIRGHRWTDHFLIVWDYVRFACELGLCKSPGWDHSTGSVVAYCLGISDIDPIKEHLSSEEFFDRAIFRMTNDFSNEGAEIVQQYLVSKYGIQVLNHFSVKGYAPLGIAEQTLGKIGGTLDFRSLPYDTPELIRFFAEDDDCRDYSYFGKQDSEALRAIERPTFEDVVEIFCTRKFKNGDETKLCREHGYARCVLFLRIAYLKMTYPKQFGAACLKNFHPFVESVARRQLRSGNTATMEELLTRGKAGLMEAILLLLPTTIMEVLVVDNNGSHPKHHRRD